MGLMSRASRGSERRARSCETLGTPRTGSEDNNTNFSFFRYYSASRSTVRSLDPRPVPARFPRVRTRTVHSEPPRTPTCVSSPPPLICFWSRARVPRRLIKYFCRSPRPPPSPGASSSRGHPKNGAPHVHVLLFPMQHPSNDGLSFAKLGSGGVSRSLCFASSSARFPASLGRESW